MTGIRGLAATLAAASLVLVAGPAMAQPGPEFSSVLLDQDRAGELTGARVTAVMSQEEYADISFNVGFEGFTALRTFAFGPGSCPRWLVRVEAPAEVFKCGWRQDGDTAILRLALRGTFDGGRITVDLAPQAMIAPTAPGRYAVVLSGWSFADVSRSVSVRPGPCGREGDGPQERGDVTCP